MFMMALQTGLIDMALPHRLGAMTIIMFIVIASLFQTVLEVTHPVLIALSASSRDLWSHVKVLMLCAMIFSVPAYMSYLLVDTVTLDLWTMVVISSSLLTSIQVIGEFLLFRSPARKFTKLFDNGWHGLNIWVDFGLGPDVLMLKLSTYVAHVLQYEMIF